MRNPTNEGEVEDQEEGELKEENCRKIGSWRNGFHWNPGVAGRGGGLQPGNSKTVGRNANSSAGKAGTEREAGGMKE